MPLVQSNCLVSINCCANSVNKGSLLVLQSIFVLQLMKIIRKRIQFSPLESRKGGFTAHPCPSRSSCPTDNHATGHNYQSTGQPAWKSKADVSNLIKNMYSSVNIQSVLWSRSADEDLDVVLWALLGGCLLLPQKRTDPVQRANFTVHHCVHVTKWSIFIFF